jgi:hypothetical protein
LDPGSDDSDGGEVRIFIEECAGLLYDLDAQDIQ